MYRRHGDLNKRNVLMSYRFQVAAAVSLDKRNVLISYRFEVATAVRLDYDTA